MSKEVSLYDQMFSNWEDFIGFFTDNNGANDTKENRRAILRTPKLCYWYCKHITDNPEVRSGITDSAYSYAYCGFISDKDDVRANIKDSRHSYVYCRFVRDDPKLAKNITNSEDAYRYCRYMRDDPEVRRNITDEYWRLEYDEWKRRSAGDGYEHV